MHHVQVPDDVGRMLRRRPSRLFLGAGDEDGDALMRIDLHAEINAGIVEILGPQRLPGIAGGAVELCRILGDGVNQAADFFSDATSIPSRNVTPLTTFGN